MFRFLPRLIGVTLIMLPAHAQKTNETQIVEIKAAVAKIGTGTKAKVEVTRRDKPKVKGFIKEICYDDFDVISTADGSNGMVVTVRYDEVVRVKGKGIDWRAGGIKVWFFGLRTLKVLSEVLKGACFGPISRCSP
jgi:hypothetical protein